MFDRSKLESVCDISVTRIGDTLSYGFPQAVLTHLPPDWADLKFYAFPLFSVIPMVYCKEALCSPLLHVSTVRLRFWVHIIKKQSAHRCCMNQRRDRDFR